MNMKQINKLYEKHKQLKEDEEYYSKKVKYYNESVTEVYKITDSLWYKIKNVFKLDTSIPLKTALMHHEGIYKKFLEQTKTKIFEVETKLRKVKLPINGEVASAQGIVNTIYAMRKVK